MPSTVLELRIENIRMDICHFKLEYIYMEKWFYTEVSTTGYKLAAHSLINRKIIIVHKRKGYHRPGEHVSKYKSSMLYQY